MGSYKNAIVQSMPDFSLNYEKFDTEIDSCSEQAIMIIAKFPLQVCAPFCVSVLSIFQRNHAEGLSKRIVLVEIITRSGCTRT